MAISQANKEKIIRYIHLKLREENVEITMPAFIGWLLDHLDDFFSSYTPTMTTVNTYLTNLDNAEKLTKLNAIRQQVLSLEQELGVPHE